MLHYLDNYVGLESEKRELIRRQNGTMVTSPVAPRKSERSSDYKAPGGKLVRVRLREEQGQIRSVKITGDFFLIPEEALGKLEKMLEDVPLREAELHLLVDRFFRATGAQSVGVSKDDFVKAILSAQEAP